MVKLHSKAMHIKRSLLLQWWRRPTVNANKQQLLPTGFNKRKSIITPVLKVIYCVQSPRTTNRPMRMNIITAYQFTRSAEQDNRLGTVGNATKLAVHVSCATTTNIIQKCLFKKVNDQNFHFVESSWKNNLIRGFFFFTFQELSKYAVDYF